MTIKIKSQRAWQWGDELTLGKARQFPEDKPVRIVRESDFRKLMKLVRAVEKFDDDTDGLFCYVEEALDALRERKK